MDAMRFIGIWEKAGILYIQSIVQKPFSQFLVYIQTLDTIECKKNHPFS